MLVVYSKNNCPECAKAAALLDAKGVEYKTVKVDEDPVVRAMLMSMGHRSVPQIYMEGQNDATLVGDYKALTKLTDEQWAALK
jgi:glutaredoxin